jgi:RHS repeat-associated protein
VDGKNQLTGYQEGNAACDDNGNLSSLVDGFGTFTYDDENQLVQVELTEWLRSQFVYDGRGRLRQSTEFSWDAGNWVQTAQVRYIYDGMRVIQERDGTNTPVVSYTRGWDLSGSMEGAGGIGGMLARSHGYSSGNWTNHNCYHADGNGNITYLVNSSQGLAASYRYDPYGNWIGGTGPLVEENVYRFSSKMYHWTSATYYYGYRWYAPFLHRWPNRDPIADLAMRMTLREVEYGIHSQESAEGNLYRFVGNSPLDYVDSTGLLAGGGPKEPKRGPNDPFVWFDWYSSLGPPGTKCVFICTVYGLGPGSKSDRTKLKDCRGLARAKLRKAAKANNQTAWDEACQYLHDCHALYE